MKRELRMLAAIAVIAGCGASEDYQPRRPTEQPSTTRRLTSVTPESVWTAQEDSISGLLRYPVGLGTLRGSIVVLDAGSGRVVSLSKRTGAVQWSAGRLGAGRERFERARAMATFADSLVFVTDDRRNDLTALSAKGELIRAWHSPVFGSVHSICALDSGRLLISSGRGDTTLFLFDLAGATVRAVDYPFVEAAKESALLRQGTLSATRDGTCVFTQTVGAALAHLVSADSSTRIAYVEEVPQARIRRVEQTIEKGAREGSVLTEVRLVAPQIATMRSAASGACVRVLFEGVSAEAGRLLDEYSLSKRAYLRTIVLPRRIGYFATDGDELYVVGRRRGTAFVSLMRVPELTGECDDRDRID